MKTFKEKFNMKYKQPIDTSNSLKKISELTGIKFSNIKKIFQKGKGAYYSNPESVRPQVTSANQWAYSRVYSAVMNRPAAKIDKDLLTKTKKGTPKGTHRMPDGTLMSGSVHNKNSKPVKDKDLLK